MYGICLRGKAGWGENMAYVSTVVNTFGGRWFDEKWQAQLTSPEWNKAVTFYVDLLKNDGPPGASSNGFNENLTLMSSGKCAMWIDATVAAGMLYNKAAVADRRQGRLRRRADRSRRRRARTGCGRGRSRFRRRRSRRMPRRSSSTWATSKEYIEMVGEG